MAPLNLFNNYVSICILSNIVVDILVLNRNPGSDYELFKYPHDQTYTELDTGEIKKSKYPLNDVQRLWSAVDSAILQTPAEMSNSNSKPMCADETGLALSLYDSQFSVCSHKLPSCCIAVLHYFYDNI